jgi:homocysteine S-methyltransferase
MSTQLERQGVDLTPHGKLWTAGCLLSPEGQKELLHAHQEFLRQGARIVLSATYQCSTAGLVEAGGVSPAQAEKIMQRGVQLAVEACDSFPLSEGKAAWVSVGPYGAMLADGSEYNGGYAQVMGAEQLRAFHSERLGVFAASGVNIGGWAVETIPSLLEAMVLAELMCSEPYTDTPCWIALQCGDEMHLADGTPIEEATRAVGEKLKGRRAPSLIGLNCCAAQHVSGLLERLLPALPSHVQGVVLYPNRGGEWNAATKTWVGAEGPPYTASRLQDWLAQAQQADKRLWVGACCSADASFIGELATWSEAASTARAADAMQ